MHVCPFLVLHLHIVVSVSYQHRNPLDLLWVGGQSARFLLLNTWGHDGPQKLCFRFKQNLFQTQKGGNGILRDMKAQEILSCIFLLAQLLCFSPPVTRKVLAGKERESEDDAQFLFLSVLPPDQEAQGTGMLLERNDIKTVELVSIVLVVIEYICV